MRKQVSKAAAALTAVALVGAAAIPLGGASAASKANSKTVKLVDSFYSPSTTKVKKGDKIVWKWVSTNSQSHNVTLKKAPSGVKKNQFSSSTARANFTFKTTFTKPGNYHFECTLHPTTMQEDVTVKKPS